MVQANMIFVVSVRVNEMTSVFASYDYFSICFSNAMQREQGFNEIYGFRTEQIIIPFPWIDNEQIGILLGVLLNEKKIAFDLSAFVLIFHLLKKFCAEASDLSIFLTIDRIRNLFMTYNGTIVSIKSNIISR